MKWASGSFRWIALTIIVWVLAACAPAAAPSAPAAPAAAPAATSAPAASAADSAKSATGSPTAQADGGAPQVGAPDAARPAEAPKAEEAKPTEIQGTPSVQLEPAAPASETLRAQEVTPTQAAAAEAPATQAPAAEAPTEITPEAVTPEAALAPPPPSETPESPAQAAPAAPVAPVPTATPPPPTIAATETPALPTASPIPVATATSAPTDTPIAPTATATAMPPTAAPTHTAPAPAPTQAASEASPVPTVAPAAKLEPAPTAAPPTPSVKEVQVETRIAELEWPPEMRLGGSESIRLALIPSTDSYTVTMENAQNQVVTQTVPVKPRPGYDLFAIAKLNAPKFDVTSDFPEQQALVPKESLRWRWLISPREGGQQTASLLLYLRWEPQAGNASKPIDGAALVDQRMQINVGSVLGMSTAQAANMGGMGLIASLALSAFAMLFRRTPAIKTTLAQVVNPNGRLKIEPNPGIVLAEDEIALLQTLFRRYGRLVVQSEFRSGYSGARTLLALPVRDDGRADAYTIAKIGDRESIQQEYDNYDRYVKDTLPPVTARIQELPVTAPAMVNRYDKAVLRYTFIGEPGKMPSSLREALLREGDPSLLSKLFDMFGPNWWMQRRPHTFRLAAEYDTILPAHYVVEPIEGPIPRGAIGLDGRMPPGQEGSGLGVGDIVFLKNFPLVQKRADGRSLSLTGEGFGGNPPLRVRWMGEALNSASAGRVTATRLTLLRELIGGAELHGFADPLPKLMGFLNENVIGSRSTIHGDLNLENILVGPGGFVWLIDFAQTREGHPLADFAHLEAEIVAHVLAPHMTASEFASMLRDDGSEILKRLHQIVQGCLLNPSQPREYWMALAVTCLGAMKYANLGPHQRHMLYLCAAFWTAKAA